MPHRAPDTRLLTTLLTSTSTLQKALNQFHQSHLSHITCLTAYASSSSPPTSSVLLASSSLLSRCIEDGLVVKLDAALEAWTKALSTLKDVEEEVGRMGRDREILIGRVIKASQKMTGSGGKRDSTLGSAAGSASSSSLGTPPLTPTGLNGRLNQSQIELQACEAALIQKENELSTLRTTAINDSLTGQFQALIDCASLFNELGSEAINLIQNSSGYPIVSPVSPPITVHAAPSPSGRPSSETSSLAPSQSASQIHSALSAHLPHTPSPLSQPGGAHIYSNAEIKHYRKDSEGGQDSIATPQSQASSSFPQDKNIPMLATTPSTPPTESDHDGGKHVLPRRITEESLVLQQRAAESDSSDAGDIQENLQVIDNPRFSSPEKGKRKRSSQIHLPLGRAHGENESNVSASTHHSEGGGNSEMRGRKKGQSGFLGTIRSFFGSKDKESVTSFTPGSSPTKSRPGALAPSPEKKDKKRKTAQFLFPPSRSATVLASGSSNTPVGLGIGVPPGEFQRKRVVSDLTGSRKLKRAGTAPPRSASGSRARAGDEFGGAGGKEPDDAEEQPPDVPPVDLGLIHQRERRVSMDRGSVKDWVERVSSAGSTPSVHAQKSKANERNEGGYASDGVSPPKPPKKKRIGKAATVKNSGLSIDGEDSVLSAPAAVPASASRAPNAPGKPVARKSSLKKANPVTLQVEAPISEVTGGQKMSRHASLPPPSRSTATTSIAPSRQASLSKNNPSTSSTNYPEHTSPEPKSIASSYHHHLKTSKNDLMSIVEAVHSQPATVSVTQSHRRTVSHQPNTNTPSIIIPTAPPPMGRADLEGLVSGATGSYNPTTQPSTVVSNSDDDGPFAIPRAPGSVLTARVSSTNSPPHQSTPARSSSEARRPTSPPAPLRSVLKTANPPLSHTSGVPSSFPPQHPPEPSVSLARHPRTNGAHSPQARPISTLSTISSGTSSSVESFATGRESFISVEESNIFGLEDNNESGDITITADNSPTQAEPGPTGDDNASTISQASIETAENPPTPPRKSTPTPVQQKTAPQSTSRANADSSEGATKTRRRKSVRVSLQPTFSPTPPALEDWESPWTSRSSATNAYDEDNPSGDVWQDSSDEDEQYSQAKRLLSR